MIAEELQMFRTADMALAAYLVVMGHRDFDCARAETDSGKIEWCFPSSDDLRELVDDYRDARAEVEPREFARAFGLVKSAMFRFKDGR